MTWPAVQTCREHNQHLSIHRVASSTTYAKIWISVQEDLPSALAADVLADFLELARCARALNFECLDGHRVLEQPARVPPSSQHELCVCFLRLNNRLLDIPMNRRLDRAHEPRAHIDSLRTQVQRRSQALSIAETSRRDEWNWNRLSCPAQQDQVRNIRLAHMSRALKPVNAQEIHAQLHRAECVSDACALVQDHARWVGLLEHLDDRTGRVAGRLDDADAFVQDCLRVGRVIGWSHGG